VAGISLALVMAFAMFAGCENTVTKTVTKEVEVPGGGSGGGVPPTPEEQLRIALTKGTAYVTGSVDITAPFIVGSGQHLVVGGSSLPQSSLNSVGGEPQFAINGGNGTLNIGALLTLEAGGKLTILTDGAVNAKSPSTSSTSTGQLTVKADATVDVKGAISVEPQAALYFESGSTLSVAKDSHVVLETGTGATEGSYGAITIESGAKLAISGVEDAASVIGAAPTDPEAATPIIVIPAGASAAIGLAAVDITVTGSDVTADQINTAITNSDAVKDSPAKTTATANDVATLLGAGDTKTETVTYTGTDALSSLSISTGKTLIIKGEVESSSITVGNGAALEIAEGASISGTITISDASAPATKGTVTNNGTISTETDITLLASRGTGTIVLTGTSTAATADITLSTQNLEIDTDGVLNLATFGISPISKITNNGTIKTAKDTVLTALLGAVSTGTVEAGDTLEIASAEVKDGATLKIADDKKLTVSGTLTVTGTLTVDGASVVGKAAGARIVVGEDGSITGTANFFDEDAEKITNTVTEGTYKWVANALAWQFDKEGAATITEKTVSDPAQVTWEGDIITVTYTGNEAITPAINQPTKTLVITGTIANQTAAISVGTLNITGSITTSGALTVATALTNGTGTIDLGTDGSITNNGGTITNSGTIKVAPTKLATLLPVTGLNGKVSVNGTDEVEITTSGTITIPTGVILTVPNDQTLKIASGVTALTVNGGGINAVSPGKVEVAAGVTFTVSSGTVTGDVTQDVSGTYELSTEPGVNPAAFTTAGNYTAIKNHATEGANAGYVTITLKGDAGVVIANEGLRNGMYVLADINAAKLAQGVSAVRLTGLLVETTAKIKQTNNGFNLWNNTANIGGTITGSGADITKDREYTALPPNDVFDIILWNDAARTTIDLEITQPYTPNDANDTEVTQKYLIDYTAVTFENATAKYSLPAHTEIDNSVGTNANKNLSGISHTARRENDIDTIYLTGPVTEDRALVATWFGAAGNNVSATGKYAIATIKGLFNGDVIANGRTLKNTNESWNWYAGQTNETNEIISNAFLTEAATGIPHVWLGDATHPDAFVWKKKVGPITDDELTVLLWSGAGTKQATLEIVPLNSDKSTLNNDAKYTVIVDWSNLVIN
jgi:hypothetical protein